MAYATVVVLEFPALSLVEEPWRNKGSAADLLHRGEAVGSVLRTR